MKVLLLIGSHTRHIYLAKRLIEEGFDVSVICMNREASIPDVPENTSAHDSQLHNDHFRGRDLAEIGAFGQLSLIDLPVNPILICEPALLNSRSTADLVTSIEHDIAIVFGTDLLRDPLLSVLSQTTINIHLGLSPWYRGSATLFWPSYFLQPQYSGATFHKLNVTADSGDILHQFATQLEPGMKIHDIGVSTVTRAVDDLLMILKSDPMSFKYSPQRTTGRLFLTTDYHPSQLRVIYDLFDNKIVDFYLNGQLSAKKPKLRVFGQNM